MMSALFSCSSIVLRNVISHFFVCSFWNRMNIRWLDMAHMVVLLWALSSRVRGQCDESVESSKLNLSVTYDLPTFTAGSTIQNLVTLNGIIYVGAVNQIYALSPNLTKLSVYRTGPLWGNQTCGRQQDNVGQTHRTDNNNVALVVETIYDKGLFSCGSADQGVCRRHVLDDGSGLQAVDEEVYCFSDNRDRGQPSNPNRVTSPAGSQVLNVESNVIHFFVGNSEIPGLGNVSLTSTEFHTISVRKMKTSQNGFTFFSNRSYIDLIPSLRGNYYLRYVYSFHSGPFVYFLTVQRVSKDSQAYHTRIVRMCSSDLEIRRYVEMPLECISTNKRRRRSTEDVKVFNVLQAAHVTKVDGEDVLFAAFAQSKPDSPEPTANSAICAISLKHINNLFKKYMQACNTIDPYHFTGSNKKSCYNVVRAGGKGQGAERGVAIVEFRLSIARTTCSGALLEELFRTFPLCPLLSCQTTSRLAASCLRNTRFALQYAYSVLLLHLTKNRLL